MSASYATVSAAEALNVSWAGIIEIQSRREKLKEALITKKLENLNSRPKRWWKLTKEVYTREDVTLSLIDKLEMRTLGWTPMEDEEKLEGIRELAELSGDGLVHIGADVAKVYNWSKRFAP